MSELLVDVISTLQLLYIGTNEGNHIGCLLVSVRIKCGNVTLLIPPMPSQPYEPVNQTHGSAIEPMQDPLLSAFGNDANSDSDWEDDRSATASETVNAPHSGEGESLASSSQSSSAPSRFGRSVLGGLLNAVSRPVTAAQTAVADGVFGNLVAKEELYTGDEELPETPLPDENDDITPTGHLPSYEEASADATPSYWETTIMTYSYGDEIIVGQMPVGSLIIFAWNLLMSSAFSYVGFILTYLFHTTHSAKGGSLVGFGITLIQSSHDISPIDTSPPGAAPLQMAPTDPNSFDPNAFDEEAQMLYPRPYIDSQPYQKHGNSVVLSNIVFALGIIMIIKGFWDYGVAMRTESLIAQRRREQSAQSEQAQAEAQENQSQ